LTHTNKKNYVQRYYYKDIGTIFIIASTHADKNSYRKDDAVKPEQMCSNKGQAIILNKGLLTIRKEATVKLGFCHQLGFDEKGFYGYAYPVE